MVLDFLFTLYEKNLYYLRIFYFFKLFINRNKKNKTKEK